MRPLGAAAVLVVGVALVACSNDADTVSTGTSRSTPTSAVAGTTADVCGTPAGATTTLLPGSGTTDVSTPVSPRRNLTAVRVACHGGAGGTFTRVVFEFASGVPGYAVRYVGKPITEDGSGRDVTVSGDAVLSVRMESASGVDADGTATYTGPTRIAGPGTSVREVVRTGDFEGVLNWVIGVRSKSAFHAYPSEGSKLVIDIAE